jgi:hypothetical protein|tara:strand:- start:622 stop:960 length:339 start_codon:yes stop_codon:yes gene_type:complete
MGKRGQPKIGEDFEILVYIKIVQYCNRYNIGPMKAWEKLTTHKAFPELMKNWHGKTRSVITNNYIERLQEDHQTQKNFYMKHISKWLKIRARSERSKDLIKKYPRIINYLKK